MENCQLKGVHTSFILQRQELNPKGEVRPMPRCQVNGERQVERLPPFQECVSQQSRPLRNVLSLIPTLQVEKVKHRVWH